MDHTLGIKIIFIDIANPMRSFTEMEVDYDRIFRK